MGTEPSGRRGPPNGRRVAGTLGPWTTACGTRRSVIAAWRSAIRSASTPTPHFVAEARAAAEARAPGLIRFLQGKAEDHDLPTGGCDVAAVGGASHAFGGTEAAVAVMARATRPGSHVVPGDGVWRRTPDDTGLETIGVTRDEMKSLADLVRAVEAAGRDLMGVAVIAARRG